MKIRLIHFTEYSFTSKVFIEPHILKFYPRNNLRQSVSDYKLTVHPEPAGFYDFLDPENNESRMVWFNGEYDSFKIQSEEIISFPNNFFYSTLNSLRT